MYGNVCVHECLTRAHLLLTHGSFGSRCLTCSQFIKKNLGYEINIGDDSI